MHVDALGFDESITATTDIVSSFQAFHEEHGPFLDLLGALHLLCRLVQAVQLDQRSAEAGRGNG